MIRAVNPIDAKFLQNDFMLNDASTTQKKEEEINCTTRTKKKLLEFFLSFLLLLFHTENRPNFSLSTDTDSRISDAYNLSLMIYEQVVVYF